MKTQSICLVFITVILSPFASSQSVIDTVYTPRRGTQMALSPQLCTYRTYRMGLGLSSPISLSGPGRHCLFGVIPWQLTAIRL